MSYSLCLFFSLSHLYPISIPYLSHLYLISISSLSLCLSLYKSPTLQLISLSVSSICFSITRCLAKSVPSFLPISKNLFPSVAHSSLHSFSLTLPC